MIIFQSTVNEKGCNRQNQSLTKDFGCMAWESWKSVKSPGRSFLVRLDGVQKELLSMLVVSASLAQKNGTSTFFPLVKNTTNKVRSSTFFILVYQRAMIWGDYFVARASTSSFGRKPWESWRTNATFVRYFAERNRTESLVVQFHHGCLCRKLLH